MIVENCSMGYTSPGQYNASIKNCSVGYISSEQYSATAKAFTEAEKKKFSKYEAKKWKNFTKSELSDMWCEVTKAPEKSKDDEMNGIKYCKNMDESFRFLEEHFSKIAPNMVLYLLYKEKGKRHTFNVLHSLPNLSVRRKVTGPDENQKQDSVAISATWKGRKDHKINSEDQSLSEILGDNENDNWNKVTGFKSYGYKKKKFMNSAGKEDILEENDYRCQSFICLNKPRQIYAFKWGFEIVTDSVIDLIAIRLDYHGIIKDTEKLEVTHVDAGWMKEEIDATLGKEFVFPIENNHVDNLIMIYDGDEYKRINIDDLLLRSTPPEIVVDVGQKAKFNLDI